MSKASAALAAGGASAAYFVGAVNVANATAGVDEEIAAEVVKEGSQRVQQTGSADSRECSERRRLAHNRVIKRSGASRERRQ